MSSVEFFPRELLNIAANNLFFKKSVSMQIDLAFWANEKERNTKDREVSRPLKQLSSFFFLNEDKWDVLNDFIYVRGKDTI